jgi:hypothetical protein
LGGSAAAGERERDDQGYGSELHDLLLSLSTNNGPATQRCAPNFKKPMDEKTRANAKDECSHRLSFSSAYAMSLGALASPVAAA